MTDIVSRYIKLIPFHNQWKLDKELDWDNDYDRDVAKIAKALHNWQATLKVALQLDKDDIARINSVGDFDLRRYCLPLSNAPFWLFLTSLFFS